jgi:hypothetical protein
MKDRVIGACSQCGNNFVACGCWAKDKDWVLTDEQIKSIIDSLETNPVDTYINKRLLSDILEGGEINNEN